VGFDFLRRLVMTNPNYLHVLKPETFRGGGGKEQTNFIKVGVAFPHESGRGFNVKITSGISVTGDIVLLPPKA